MAEVVALRLGVPWQPPPVNPPRVGGPRRLPAPDPALGVQMLALTTDNLHYVISGLNEINDLADSAQKRRLDSTLSRRRRHKACQVGPTPTASRARLLRPAAARWAARRGPNEAH